MKTFQRMCGTLALTFAAGVCGSAGFAEEIKVGVYSGIGQEGILEGLSGIEDVRGAALKDFSPAALSRCDVIVWPHGRLATADRTRLWRVLLTEYVKAGGGLILTHDAVGGGGVKRGDTGVRPLFGDIARCPGYGKRKDKTVLLKAPGVDHSLTKALPDKLTHAFHDHMALMTGPDGTTLMVDEDGDPVVAAGGFGKGRVVLMGNLPGYKATKTFTDDGMSQITDQGPAAVKGGELTLVAEAARWAGEPLAAHPVVPSKLAALLETAADKEATKPAAAEQEAVKILGDAVSRGELDTQLWEFGAETWRGDAHWRPWRAHMFLFIKSADQPLTSKFFEKSPVKGGFLFTGDVVLSEEMVGVLEWRIINEDANKDVQDGYGIRLVCGGLQKNPRTGEKPEPGDAICKIEEEVRTVKIGDARHAILKITRGKVTELTTVEAPGHLMTPGNLPKETREKYVPIRFERTEEGVLLFSIDGLVVARAKDKAYDDFTKLRAIMTTARGRIGFDNPTLVGHFARETEEFAPTPWIVPEPKEMTKNGKTFALKDGTQFVISGREKIDTYHLNDWIIPEIEGRYGIRMKAVTVDEVDKTKPAIYLGEGDDPALAKIFEEDLKSVSSQNPGPAPGEGYVIRADAGRVHAAGAGIRGTFYALQSLVQLIERDGETAHLRGADIRDWPDFQLRGPWSGLRGMRNMVDDTKEERAERVVRFFVRYKVNAVMLGGIHCDFPSYDLSYGGYSSWKDTEWTYRLCEKYHIEVIPSGFSLCHTGLHRQRGKKELWKWMVENRVLPKGDETGKGGKHECTFNATSPAAWQMCKALNQDYINISPSSRFFLSWFDEIYPPIHTYAPEGTDDDLLEEWILKIHKHLKENGKRMMMFPSFLTEAAKFRPGSSAMLGLAGSQGMPVHDVIDRIPKDIIMVDWYYGPSPNRTIFKYLRDKGFDVITMPGSKNYGYTYQSLYYSAVEGKKAGLMGIFQFSFQWGTWTNPSQFSYSLPLIYNWRVPETMKPDWDWRAHWQEVFLGPQPSHTGEVVPLDISAACNESRIDEEAGDGKGWLDYGKHADLRNLPAGELVQGRYRFNVVDESKHEGRSVIVVAGHEGQKGNNGAKVTDIPVGCRARALVFLHASTSLGKVCNGANRPARYRVHYEDGTSVEAPLNYAQQIGPWMYSVDIGNPRNAGYLRHGYFSSCRLVRTGRTTLGEKTGLYAYEWANPHPEKKILSIDMEPSVLDDWIWETQIDAQRVALVALSAVSDTKQGVEKAR